MFLTAILDNINSRKKAETSQPPSTDEVTEMLCRYKKEWSQDPCFNMVNLTHYLSEWTTAKSIQ
jgi:hypothetical protein